jgi:glyoxylase-like metal-dependent hydrolase (beta-lactamase superfamily II)
VASIMIGDVEIIHVEEARAARTDLQEIFPDYKKSVAERAGDSTAARRTAHNDGGSIVPVIQSWVLRSGGLTLVVDTGIGEGRLDGDGSDAYLASPYLAALGTVGVDAADVDIVALTHLHRDHVGWNTRWDGSAWIPTFPAARYLLSHADVAFWGPKCDGRLVRVGDSFNRGTYQQSIEPIMSSGHGEEWQGSYTVDASIRLHAAPGHTPGSAIVIVESRGECAILVGDVLHSPIQVELSDLNSCFCEDPIRACATRASVLAWAADHHALLFGGHFGGDGALEIERDGSRFSVKRRLPLSGR